MQTNEKQNSNSNSVRIGAIRKDDDGEYSVPVYVNGKRSEKKTYYAADKADAIATRDAMIAEQGALADLAKAPLHDAQNVLAFVVASRALGASVVIVDRDEPEDLGKMSPTVASSWIIATDETTVRVETATSKAWFHFVFGNEPEDGSIADHTDNALGNALATAAHGGAS